MQRYNFHFRFGDQIVQINGDNMAGLSSDKAISKMKKSDPLKCEVYIAFKV